MKHVVSRIVKVGIYVIALIVVGAAGLLVGHLIQGSASHSDVERTLLNTRLNVGDRFPEVTLVNGTGESVTTSDLLEPGGIVLFVDVECDPCTEMSRRWQVAIDAGIVENDWVIGVTNRLPDRIEQYRAAHGFTFNILYDPATVFGTRYNVRLVPYEVVVGASGRIRSTSRERSSPVNADALFAQMTN